MFGELRVFVQNSFAYSGVEVYIFTKDRERHFAAPLTMLPEPTPAQSVELAPTFRLDPTSAQELIDQLWQCGLRPTEGTGSAGALAATQKHLEDMRTLVFDYAAKAIKPCLPS